MASSAKSLPLLFLLLALFSPQISHARDSKFFSKMAAAVTVTSTAAANPVVEVNPNKLKHEPTFIPDTQNSYGLYGHESGQLPPSTTTTTSAAATTTTSAAGNHLPFETQFQQPYSYYNKHAYVTKPQGYLPSTTFFNNHPQNGGYTAAATTSTAAYDSQQLGMSDTRFLENGKYYYDTKGKYSNKGYNYGNNEINSNEYRNSMEGFQNQNQNQYFQEGEEEFEP